MIKTNSSRTTGIPPKYLPSQPTVDCVTCILSQEISASTNGTGDSSSESVTSGEDLPVHQHNPHPPRSKPRRPPPPPPPSSIPFPQTTQQQQQQQTPRPSQQPLSRPTSLHTNIPSNGHPSPFPTIAVTLADTEVEDAVTSDTTPEQATTPDPCDPEFKQPVGIPAVIMRKKKVPGLAECDKLAETG